jgi:hypothetical protein
MDNRHWDGKTVHIQPDATRRDRRSVEIGLTPETARELAMALHRVKQTTFGLQNGPQELLDALDYVFVGDPRSVVRHSRMQAAKGMEPAGADPRSYPAEHGFIPDSKKPEWCCWKTGVAQQECGRPESQHVKPPRPRPLRDAEERR